MGCVILKEARFKGKKEETLRARKADALLQRTELDHLVPQVNLLLLGSGESGKSTFMKQLKNIYLNGFPPEEKNLYVNIIHSNAITAMRSIISYGQSLGPLPHLPENKENIELLMRSENLHNQMINKAIGRAIKELWKDPAIIELYHSSEHYQLLDSAAYLFENIDEIAREGYTPSPTDILMARARTVGMHELCFYHNQTYWRVVDVGGQRDERKQWIHCFGGVSAVLFCVALSEYNLKLYEDEKVNRMEESLLLFEEIGNFPWFADVPIVLLLNKSDLFSQKITHIDMKPFFPDYDGGCNYEKALAFIKNKFTVLLQNSMKPMYIHVCCAINEHRTKEIFTAISNIILREQISNPPDLF